MNKELKGTSTLHRAGVEKISYVRDDIEAYISNAKFGNGNVNF